ncbi:MAG TPA: TetR family transcriptional regulator [Micromonosporaceae bacterium]
MVVVRTGRRPGNQDTREAILAAARSAFAERGYDAASIRHIATAANVDPALVHHYFGTKDQLFLAALDAPIDPARLVPQAIAGSQDGVGERLIRMLLSVWDSAAGGPAAALLRSAVGNETMARMMREFVVNRILKRVAKDLDLDPVEGPVRANLVATQIGGLVMIRYILKIEPLASAPAEQVVALIGPTVQRYLFDPLPTAWTDQTRHG